MPKIKTTARKANRQGSRVETVVREVLQSRKENVSADTNPEPVPGCSYQTDNLAKNRAMPPPRSLKRLRTFRDESSDEDEAEDFLPPPVRRRYIQRVSTKVGIASNLQDAESSNDYNYNSNFIKKDSLCVSPPPPLELEEEHAKIFGYSPSSPDYKSDCTYDIASDSEEWSAPIIVFSDKSDTEDGESHFSDDGSERSSVIWLHNHYDSSSGWDSSAENDTENEDYTQNENDTNEAESTESVRKTPWWYPTSVNEIDSTTND